MHGNVEVQIGKYAMLWWTKAGGFLNKRRMSYAWIAAGALWLVWFISIIFGTGNMDLAGQVVGTDYIQFYTAGKTVRLGMSERLYDFTYQQQLQMEIAGPAFDTLHAFITPPYLALVFVPFSIISYGWSFLAWSILGLVGLWISLQMIVERSTKEYLLWSLSWFPVFATISFGQNSLLSLVLIVLVYVLWKKEKRYAAGMLSSLVLYKPQLILGVVILWMVDYRRSWKALLGLLTGAGILVGLNFVMFPSASHEYLKFTLSALPALSSQAGFPIWHSQTLSSFWQLIFPESFDRSVFFHLILSVLGIIAFISVWKKFRNDLALVFSAAVVLTLWITPHALVYEWTLLLIPAILLWQGKYLDPEKLRVDYALMWIAIFISGPMTKWLLSMFSRSIQVSSVVFAFVLTNVYLSIMRTAPEISIESDISDFKNQ